MSCTPKRNPKHFYLRDKLVPLIGDFIKVYPGMSDLAVNWGPVESVEVSDVDGYRIWIRGLGDEPVRYTLWDISWEII